MSIYNHKDLEDRWRKYWEEMSVYATNEDTNKEKYYSLVMFPYPSGSGLHIGHARAYIGPDIYTRLKRMQGFSVLHPMGWDAFGLPAEEYAIKHKKHPRNTTKENIATFKIQQQKLGLSYDWNREINTTDPKYYKWTQWIFLQLYKKGLAYQSHAPVNWCPSCKTGLANEDLEQGMCERCGSNVERKALRQWVLRITDYADRLVDDLDTLDGWEEYVKDVQRNWIGRGYGYDIPFSVSVLNEPITIFTTRPDTLFGCSFIALAPESPYVEKLLQFVTNKEEIERHRNKAYVTRPQDGEREKSGVLCEGVKAVHPITKQDVPIFIADYVLAGYGTGAIFGSPAHDERDFVFAKTHNLDIKRVIQGDDPLPTTDTLPEDKLINSDKFNGMTSEEAKVALSDASGGKKRVAHRLEDWLFSRQRYWGEPIPLIHCDKCGVVPVPEEDLPVLLPSVESYEPTGDGDSPLANIDEWVNTECPVCGSRARRETNTMPQWAGSSWYHLRYIDPHNENEIIDSKKEKRWMPVDTYTGGMEHAARHLIYARFWHKFLYDIGVVHTIEPYRSLRTVGILQAEGGGKMSKRLGNVVDPIDVAETVGTDAMRLYIAYLAPFSQTVAWDSKAIAGTRRFLERVYAMRKMISVDNNVEQDKDFIQLQHHSCITITRDIENYKFNTAVASLMIFSNALQKFGDKIPRSSYEVLLRLLAPFAPFITEEIWHNIGNTTSIHTETFPLGDTSLAKKSEVTIAVQVQGKMCGCVVVKDGSTKEEVVRAIKDDARLSERIAGRDIKVYVENKIISFV